MQGWNIRLAAVCLISMTTVAGCGGERRSGAVAGGDTASVADTTAARAADTTATVPIVRTDTAARRDTALASAPSPAPVRTQPAKKPAPKPAAKPAAPTPAPEPADSSTAEPAPADTTPSASPPRGEATTPLRDEYHQAPRDTVAPTVYDGWKQFNLNCARCHGEDVQGTTIAPHLIVSLRPDGPINTKEKFVQTVCAGRPEKGMPAWCPLGMDMQTIEAIYQYVKARSEGKVHPGRPARREG
jgi:mono/diheme cytochrome c family protein